MNFFKHLVLAGCLLLALPACATAAETGAAKPAFVPGNVPLQEEMHYLTPAQLAEEENLLAILWVQRSAEFRGLCYQAYNMAAMEVDRAVARRKQEEKELREKRSGQAAPPRPLAVVLDIDDTIVSHAPLEMYYLERPEAKADYNAWNQWIARHKTLLPGAVDFMKHARAKGVQVFYVTGRGPQDKEVTLGFLREAGLPFAEETHLLMNDRSGSKMNHFTKLGRRYNIICYIGDNVADFPIDARREENEIKYREEENAVNENSSVNNNSELKTVKQNDVKIRQPLPLDIRAMLKHDKNKKRNAKADANQKAFGAKFILLPNPMYGDWEYNLAKKYRSLPAEQRIALRKAAVKSLF